MQKIKILGIAGSLRSNSSTHQMMCTVEAMFPDFVEFEVYNRLGQIPPFDDSENVPVEVLNFRNRLKEVDGVLFISPEYAFGIPGVLKNALDWTVSSAELVNKPAALIVAATGGENAYHSLLLVFKALSLNISEESRLLISFIRSKLSKEGQLKDQEIEIKLIRLVEDFVSNIRSAHPDK